MFDIICNYTLYYTKTYFRYYLCTSCNDWETMFVSFKQTDESSTKLTLKMEISRNLSLDEQQALLMTLPNHHKWPFLNSRETKYDQQFSNSRRRYPGSPRNRIIQAWFFREEPFEIIHDVLVNLFCCSLKIRYPEKEKRAVIETATRPARPKKRTLAEVLGFLQVVTL